MAAPRLRKVASKREFDNIADDYITQGCEIINQGENTALLRKKTWGTSGGHVMCLLFTVWFSLGFGNLIYALVAHYSAETVLLKIEEQEYA